MQDRSDVSVHVIGKLPCMWFWQEEEKKVQMLGCWFVFWFFFFLSSLVLIYFLVTIMQTTKPKILQVVFKGVGWDGEVTATWVVCKDGDFGSCFVPEQ